MPVVRSASSSLIFVYFHRNHHDNPLRAWFLTDFFAVAGPVAEPAYRLVPAAWCPESRMA